MAADLRQRGLVVLELDDLAAGRGAEAVTVGHDQRADVLNELGELGIVDLGADDGDAGAEGGLGVGLAGLELLQRLLQVGEDQLGGTHIAHQTDHVELVAGDDRVLGLAHLADLLDDAAHLVMLGHSRADRFIGDVRAEGLVNAVEHVRLHLLDIAGHCVVGDLEGHVGVGHEEIGVLVDLEDLEVLHGAVHHRAGVDADQRVQILVAALNGALEQGAGVLAGVVGHVVGGDVDGTGVRGAEPGREAVVNVEQDLGDVEAGIAQADAAIGLRFFHKLIVGVLKQVLKVDQMLKIFQMLHLFFSDNFYFVECVLHSREHGRIRRQPHNAVALDVVGSELAVRGDRREDLHARNLRQRRELGVGHAVEDDADAVIVDELVGDVLDGGDDLGALLALVGDEQQMGDLIHHAALDLLDACLAVDHDVVEAVGEHADDFLEIRVDLAVAAGALRPADGQKREARHLHQRIENTKARLGKKLERLSGLAVFHAVDDAHANPVEREFDVYTKSNRQADGGIRVDRKDLLVGILLDKRPHDARTDRRFADAALACDRDDLGLIFHMRPP